MAKPIPSCFRGHGGGGESPPNLTTCFYSTPSGGAALTWSRTLFGHSLRAQLHLAGELLTHSIDIKPWFFWKKQGCKTLSLRNNTQVRFSWDLASAKFLAGPEPVSGFSFAIAVDSETAHLAGEGGGAGGSAPRLVLRQEHVVTARAHTTKAYFAGKTRDISVDCNVLDDPRLVFSIDGKRVLQVKRLKWKFRGNERIEFEGTQILLSWDVYNWLFDDSSAKDAVFMFRFEEKGACSEKGKGVLLWQPWEVETSRKTGGGMKKKDLVKTSSCSSSSSVSSGGSSSVMDWTSAEESELQNSEGFSLLIHAWRS